MVAGVPSDPVVVPAAVTALALGRPTRPVWEDELGGLTFEVGERAERCFVKWVAPARGPELDAEAVRLRWAVAFVAVPEVLALGSDDTGAWLVTSPLPGTNAVAERWRAEPAKAVAAIGGGLRALHDALPVDGCPFSWSASDRVDDARRRATAGLLEPARWLEAHRSLTVDDALALVGDRPPIDRLVVCHGDACAPNTLLTDDGRWSGHVDLGALGTADRWADLAVATWSTEWNYGPGWERPLLDAYGVEPDEERTRYYRLLLDLGP